MIIKKQFSYSTLKNKIVQEKLTKIIDDLKVFFAFSDKQFLEGLEKINEKKENMMSIGMGGFIPRKNAKKYVEKTTKLNEWFVKKVGKLNPNEVIRYELNNYEAYWTGDISTAYEVLKDYGFTTEDVWNVFHNKNYVLGKKEN